MLLLAAPPTQFDLLANRSQLVLREDGDMNVQVVGLVERNVVTTEQLLELLAEGNQARRTGSTDVNADSSRSHAILRFQMRSFTARSVMGQVSSATVVVAPMTPLAPLSC